MGTSLNSILARWLDDAVAPVADCGACARFGKCCDFQPFVPNFMVGAALAAGASLPTDSNKFRRQPLGLIPTAAFRAGRDARGDRPATVDAEVCAFYRDGRCTIWAWRPGECSAYSCAGENHALAGRAFALETTIAQRALREDGVSAAAVDAQIDILNEPGDQLADVADAERSYRRAWDWVRSRTAEDVKHWLEDI